MYDVFQILLLEQNTTKKRWVDEKAIKLDIGNNEENKIEVI